MTPQEILEKLKPLLNDVINMQKHVFDVEKITEKTEIAKLNLTHFDKNEFVFDIEMKFDISISDSQMDNCESFEDLIFLIKQNL